MNKQKIEIWKDIRGWEGYYQISCWGRVRSWNKVGPTEEKADKPKIMKLSLQSSGYLSVGLHLNGKQKTIYVHRLVAIHFVSNPENKPEVNHKDGVKIHNWSTNVEWSTSKENSTHAIDNGLIHHRGEKHPHSKLTESEVQEMRDVFNPDEMSYTEIAQKYDIDRTTAWEIINKKTWKHV